MNKNKKNSGNDALNKLLREGKKEKETFDEFEKEALEGFASLSSDEEALAAKDKLDTRMEKEVFNQKTKHNNSYWVAAAVLLLVVSFSIYLIKDQATSLDKELAILPTDVNQDQSVDMQIEETLKEKNNNAITEEEKLNNVKTNSSVSENDASTKDNTSHRNEQKENYDQAKFSDAAQDKDAELATDDAVSSQMSIASAEQPVSTSQPLESKDIARSPSSARAQGNAGAPAQKEEIVLDSKKSIPSKKTKALESSSFKTTVKYEGGEKAFQIDLKELLAKNKLLYSFEANLIIDSSAKVIEVKYLQHDKLNEAQLQKLTSILKSMTKFEITEVGNQNLTHKYLVSFKN